MSQDKRDLHLLLKLLSKYNLKATADILRNEANIKEEPDDGYDTETILSGFETEGSPEVYENSYQELRNCVENSLDIYKHELAMVLYPVLVQIYLKLLNNGHQEQARTFLQKYLPEQESYYQEDIRSLLLATSSNNNDDNDVKIALETEKFVIRISRDSLSLLKRHIQDKKLDVISQILNNNLCFDLYEGVARTKIQCEATAGSVIGEARRQDNKVRVFYGLLKEIDFQTLTTPPEEEDDGDQDALDKPKKKKAKKDPLFSKKSKSDPNAPAQDRIPLPELKDADKMEKIKALREASKRVNLSKDSLPSVCFYTILNAANTVTCAEICDDSSMLAVGFMDSNIKVWSLTPSKLREMKSSEQLKDIDKEAEDVAVRMMDDRTAESVRILYGHSGPVYRCSFSPDKTLLLSCSEDASVRLWSFHTWTCLVVYKGHQYPVWDVRFSPHGYYFATCSHDKTARLWATDVHLPWRLFVGHLSDVDCVLFHPNSNYIGTGSSDRTVRLWDCLTGHCVRLMTGHKAPIYSLAFSTCGRYLASGSSDNRVLVWDISHGQLVTCLTGHAGTIHTLCFSRDGTILCSGSLDCTLKMWDFTKLCEEFNGRNTTTTHDVDGDAYLLRSFPTKSSTFITLHFTRKNLLLAVGMFKNG